MASIYFIRHGETRYNQQGIVQGGGIDSDLNDTGRSQADRFFQKYQNIPFQGVYCTALKRTFQTVQQFEEKGYGIQPLPGLNELSWGIMEGKSVTDQMQGVYKDLTVQWAAGAVHVAPPDGESPQTVWERAQPEIEHLCATLGSTGKALVCTHGRTLRIVLSMLLGYGLEKMSLFPHDNTGLNLLHQQANGKWTAEKLNDLSHLE